VRVNDFINVRGCHASVPHGVGIHDYCGAGLALIEASGFVCPDFAVRNPALLQLGLEYALKFRVTRRIAAASRVAVRALIGADKNVFFKLCHGPLWKRSLEYRLFPAAPIRCNFFAISLYTALWLCYQIRLTGEFV
jgi:hypothetical protein